MCIKYVIVKNTLYLVAQTMFYILKKLMIALMRKEFEIKYIKTTYEFLYKHLFYTLRHNSIKIGHTQNGGQSLSETILRTPIIIMFG